MTDRGARRYGYQHVEAFCLMTYRNATGDEEILWNSRDGVTPFAISLRDGSGAEHAEWHRDKFAPLHVPEVGGRIFVSATRAMARSRGFEGVFRPGRPAIVEVTDEIAAVFAQRRKGVLSDGDRARTAYAAAVRRGMPPSGRFA